MHKMYYNGEGQEMFSKSCRIVVTSVPLTDKNTHFISF